MKKPSGGFLARIDAPVWSVEFDEPVPLDLPDQDQVDRILETGYVAEANEAFAKMHRSKRGEIVGLRLDRLMPRSLPGTMPFFRDVVRSGYRLVDVRTSHLRADGTESATLNAMIGTIVDGKVVRLWGTGREIEGKQEIENEIRLRSIAMETMTDGCIIVDAVMKDMPIVYANAQFSAITGYPAHEAVGRNCRFLQGPGTSPDIPAAISDAIDNRDSFQGEILNYRKNGEPFWNFLRLSPVFADGGDVTHYVGILSDVTGRKLADEQIRKLAAGLISLQEDQDRHRSRELHDDVTQRLAALAIDVASVASDAGDSPERVRAGLRRLQEELSDLAATTQELSRQLHPKILEDLGLAKAVGSACRRFSKQTGLEVDLSLDAGIDLSPGQSLCLYRILQESLVNIHRHARASFVEIQLSDSPAAVTLVVRDDGAGFDPAASRSGNTLGLVSMSERARLCNGTLEIASAPGEGTSITATIPRSSKTTE